MEDLLPFVGTGVDPRMGFPYGIAAKYVSKGLPSTDGREPSAVQSHCVLKSVPRAHGLEHSE